MSALILSVICLIFVAGTLCAGKDVDYDKMKSTMCVEKDMEKIGCMKKNLGPLIDKIEGTGCKEQAPVCGNEMESKFCESSEEELKSCCECLLSKLEGDDLNKFKKTQECLS
ncbi:uncharacterized protein [Parasteatoda tepidariorum]|uniref:uncharacterized protein n=1 Tax=Parasteatoda tepidariorum TaxID=114398 RepID=UPI00077FD08B|nr:uncharacterized protein LOC107457237 [Parasteatoda tepidariorum]